MKKLKWIVSFILILVVAASCMFIANGAGSQYQLGDRIEDFTITAYDGRTFTLSEILEEKDMVVLNFWATWCGYCVMEFPHMEEAYQKYSDEIEIIAISCEAADTDEVIAGFAAEHGLSFPMSTDAAGLGAVEHLTAKTAVAPQRQLLFHQTALGIHVLGEAHVHKTAIFLPHLLAAVLFQLFIKTHEPHLPRLFSDSAGTDALPVRQQEWRLRPIGVIAVQLCRKHTQIFKNHQ